MKFIGYLATLMVVMNCELSLAQDAFYYGAYYAPTAVVIGPPAVMVAPAPAIVQMSYVPQPVVAYAVPVYVPQTVATAPVFVSAPVAVAHTPYSAFARETSRVTRYGVDYRYREFGPLGAQRYHYSVNSRPNGYVVREWGR